MIYKSEGWLQHPPSLSKEGRNRMIPSSAGQETQSKGTKTSSLSEYWTCSPYQKKILGILTNIYISLVSPKGNLPWIFTGRTDAEAEAPILWPPDSNCWLFRKDPDSGKDWRQEEKGTTEDEMVGWHHRLNGHEFEQAPGDGDGQGGLVCCSPWVTKSQTRLSDWTPTTNKNSCYIQAITTTIAYCFSLFKKLIQNNWILEIIVLKQSKHLTCVINKLEAEA